MTDRQAVEERLAAAKAQVREVQEFDSSSVGRRDHLGADLHMEDAVQPVQRVVDQWGRLPLAYLDDLPIAKAEEIAAKAKQDMGLLEQILSYGATQGEAPRQQLLKQIGPRWESTWEWLRSWRSDAVSAGTDFSGLRVEARAMIDEFRSEVEVTQSESSAALARAQQAQEAAERVAAEHGAQMEARHFKKSADEHDTDAAKHLKRTIFWAIGIGVYALAAVFAHALLKPVGAMEHAQLIVSKVIIFGVLSYMFILSGRSFIAARHNSVVNRHRQSALLSFQALVAATDDPKAKEVILQHAAACIYSPQPTGFGRGASSDRPSSSAAVVEVMTNAVKPGAPGG